MSAAMNAAMRAGHVDCPGQGGGRKESARDGVAAMGVEGDGLGMGLDSRRASADYSTCT